MRKIVLFIITIFIALIAYIDYSKSSYFKVFNIASADKIYLDLNKNLIFDEDEPYIISDLFGINDYNGKVTEDKKRLFDYFANEFINDLLKNSFVQIKDNNLYINNDNYKNILIDSGFFYDNTEESIKRFENKLNSYNPDDYVILNLRSNKYHKFSCKNSHISKTFKIIKITDIKDDYLPAKCCFADNNANIITSHKENKNGSYSSGFIKVYYIDGHNMSKPDNKCQTDACISLKKEIDSAKQTIDFAVYGFNNQPQIYDALKAAKERGVKIRWVTDDKKSNIEHYPDLDKLKKLLPDFNTNSSISSTKSRGIMHNKFFIFDRQKVFTGSSNITSTDLSGFNVNYTILIDSKEAAKIFEQEFEQLYSGKFSVNKKKYNNNKIILNDNTSIEILFSPQNEIINSFIIKLINNAQNYIYMPIFFITDNNIKTALINAAKRNIEIRVINDATNASSKYSIHKELRNNGISVKTENFAGKLHSKSIVIDDKYSLIGSMNFSHNGNNYNDENVIIIDNESIAKYIKSTFLNIWYNIPDKYIKYDPKAESKESAGSCNDDIDNDFDGKIDSQDEGCSI